jgi:cytochrome c-type biogenesis protein CcmH
MALSSTQKRRIAPATIALALAALLAVAAIGIAIFRSGETVDEATATTTNSAAPVPTMDQTVATITERLREDPDNHEGWHMLGLLQRDAGNVAEAERAFRRAMQLAPNNAEYVAYTAEMLFIQQGRNVTPEAERLMRRALELEPGNPQARYYLATLKDMRGDHRGAINDLAALLREAPAGAPWEPQVREAATRINQANNLNAQLPPPSQPARSTATAAIPGPTREQLAAASAIPPSQQNEMVRGMVEGLANRLRTNPRDEQGWVRLMRSRMVLQQPDQARDALRSALAAFASDSAAQGRLRQAAGELGVPTA